MSARRSPDVRQGFTTHRVTITITICYRPLASRTDIGLQHPTCSTTFLSRGRLLKHTRIATLHPKHRPAQRARRTENTTERQNRRPRRTPLTGPAEPTSTHDVQNPRLTWCWCVGFSFKLYPFVLSAVILADTRPLGYVTVGSASLYSELCI